MSSRLYSTLLKPKKKLTLLSKKTTSGTTLTKPARTRFAPSPTGFLHLGSLRTALYNYLLAKRTGGDFLLRLEDTDQKRLVKGAEQNIYDSLKWCGLKWDEGPIIGGPHEPYRQSDRSQIYQQYTDRLLESGHAYRCFCSKERLDGLRESAQRLTPPTTVSYDRNCGNLSREQSDLKASNGEEFTVRFKSENHYPKFTDLLHGSLDLQPQIHKDDIRYDDYVLMKSDNLPTYHFANVIDDHLMQITHVIRGEEWLPSTPKHIALYRAFGWNEPEFIHIPLLTSTKDKKLSKRSGDIDVTNYAKRGILPEALINFVALFGWAPKKTDGNSEIMNLQELVKAFEIDDLTKGNAKVDEKKLFFFNKHYLQQRIAREDVEIFEKGYELLKEESRSEISKVRSDELLKLVGHNLTTVNEIVNYNYLLSDSVDYQTEHAVKFLTTIPKETSISILSHFTTLTIDTDISNLIAECVNAGNNKKDIFQVLRFALIGSIPGLKIPELIQFLGVESAQKRIVDSIKFLE
ncbi:hypothetical protein WICPIJ_005621 [Wickerhamomyces pijperi]|uniref:Glutamate--tRNA ligase, mitochondrial n=1 Tax=Wickerhamomyces pijperi TaxID=599730 RepID=A0A9P8Q375_WICPI|nr:hypothetical protein WICPIJ_005621 [Wickerhamomyces pijperi]